MSITYDTIRVLLNPLEKLVRERSSDWIDKAPRQRARKKKAGAVRNGPGTLRRKSRVLTWRRNAARSRRALNLNRQATNYHVVAFIYFHFLGDRNLFPPPRLDAAPNVLISPAAGEHLHDLLTGRLKRVEPSTLSSDSSASEVTRPASQSTTNLAPSEAARRDEGKPEPNGDEW